MKMKNFEIDFENNIFEDNLFFSQNRVVKIEKKIFWSQKFFFQDVSKFNCDDFLKNLGTVELLNISPHIIYDKSEKARNL